MHGNGETKIHVAGSEIFGTRLFMMIMMMIVLQGHVKKNQRQDKSRYKQHPHEPMSKKFQYGIK